VPVPGGDPAAIPSLVALGLLALGWVAGSFPSAVLVGRAVGIDPRTAGEGNPGAANVGRLAGPRAGLAVLLLDAGKAILPALLGWAVAGYWGAVTAGVGAVAGSIRPVVPGWRGGRGVGAAAGAAIAINPAAAAVGLVAAGIGWLVLQRASRATAIGFVAYPVAWAALFVRDRDSLLAMAGCGLLYLVALGGWLATRGRPRPPQTGSGTIAR
jgi:glycerol-3-phosphate acyltransferase PlsY